MSVTVKGCIGEAATEPQALERHCDRLGDAPFTLTPITRKYYP
jgi:hypothetical protein